jgi:hypothetical protein
MASKRTAISPFLRAVLATSVIGLTFLPIAWLFCGVYFPTAPAAPSLRPLVPSGSLIVCQLIQVYHHHPAFQVGGAKLPKVAGAPTSPAPTLCAVSLSVSEGANPSTMSSQSLPVTNGNPDYSLHELQPESLPVDPTGCPLASKM